MSDTNSEILVKLSAIDNLTPVMVKALQDMQANSAKMATALDSVSTATAKSAENTEGLHGGLVSVAAGMELAEQGIELVEKGFEALGEFMEKSIDVALEAEKAQTQLTGSLISTGKYTAELNDALNEFAETQQRQNGVSAETVKNILSVGLNMGMSAQKAQELVMASQRLAAATGTDTQTAFMKLQQSLAGHARALATSVAGVNDLSASQLRNGAAIDLVNSQLTAQFQLYQGSFSAGIARAHEGVEDLYKTFGQLIVQNPAVKEALSQFATVLGQIDDFASKNKAEMQAWVSQGVLALIDSLEGVNLVFDGIYRGGVIAFNGVEGALETFALGVVSLTDGPLALLYKALSLLPGQQGQRFSAMADQIGAHMAEMANNVDKSAKAIDNAMAGPTKTSQALEANILKVRDAVQTAISTEGQHQKSLEETNVAMAAQNAQTLALQKSYAGFTYGTLQQREQLQAQVADRDGDLKNFTAYLDAKERLAVSKAQEEQMNVNAIRAKAMTGAVGGGGEAANAQVAVDAETKKQAALQVLRQKGILSEQQFQNAILASVQKAQSQELAMDQAFAKAEAAALGNTPEAFQKRQVLANQQFILEQNQKKLRAKQMGLTEAQIQSSEVQANKEHLAQMQKDEQNYYEQQAQLNDQLGNNFEAYLDRVHAAQVTQGAVMGALQATINSSQFKVTQQGLNQLATLTQSHARGAFEVGKAAAIASAIVNTASAAVAALAPPPLGLGPIFGIPFAAIAAAAGAVQISNISSQQFNPGGGQADQGLDSVPSALSGKSFILSQGERVVQPEANKDLTDFLNKQKSASGAGGAGSQVFNITLNYSGSMSKDDVENMSEMLIKKIRDKSSRGVPVINQRGITNT